MKKILSILLAMAMALTLFSLPVMAKPHAELDSYLMPVKDVIVDLEFNNENYYWANYAGGTDAFYYTGGDKASTVTGANISGDGFLSVNGEISMYLKNPADNGNGWAANASDYDVESNLLRDTYVTEFDFMLPEKPSSNMNYFFSANSNSGQGVSHGPKLRLTSSQNINVEYGNGTQATVTPSTLQLNTWYTLKMVNNLKTQSYDLYLNGVLIGNDLKYLNAKLEANVFNRPFVINTTCSNNTVGTVCFDNLKIYKEAIGRQTFAADDFSGNGTDAYYNSTTELREFGGFALYPRNNYQSGVKIDAANERAEFSVYATLYAGFAKTWNAPDNTLTDSLIGKKQVSVEFDFTPSSETVGEFYQITDAVGTHHGLILEAKNGKISAQVGAEGNVNPTSANRGVDLASFTAGETYRIKVYVDLDKKFTQNLTGNSEETHNKAHTRSGKADIYIDGKLVGKELPLRYNCKSTSNASYDITNLGRPFAATGGAKATYYIDNLAIYTDVREKVLSTALNAVEKNVSQKTFTLPSSTVDGYAITWASNSDAIAISGNTATVTTSDATQKVTLTATVADTAGELAVSGKVDVTVAPDYEVYVGTEDKTIVGVIFYDNYSSGKTVDLFAAVYNTDLSMDSCAVINNAVSGKTNTIGVTLEEGQTVRIFVLTDGTLVPVAFTEISSKK